MRTFAQSLAIIILFTVAALSQTPTSTPKPVEDDGDVVKISTTLIQIDATLPTKRQNYQRFETGRSRDLRERVKQEISNFSFVSNVKTADLPDPGKLENPDKNAVPIPTGQLKPEQVRRTVALVVDDLSLSFQSTYYVQRA